MNGKPQFALNHMSAPSLGLDAFFDLAVSLGVGAVEIRNDLQGRPILDGTKATAVREAAARCDLRIISINALQRFNAWNDERAREARELIDYAADCGAEALVLVPVNDGTGRADGERRANLSAALQALAPMLQAAGVKGLVEPLGFEQSSLRFKSEAVEAIRSLDLAPTFSLVHDTFHHHLAGERDIFPDLTGLAHISGVNDETLPVSEMRDSHRVLVDAHDRLGNIDQIEALTDRGYAGYLSFEPFADTVHQSPDIAAELHGSMDYVRTALAARAG